MDSHTITLVDIKEGHYKPALTNIKFCISTEKWERAEEILSMIEHAVEGGLAVKKTKNTGERIVNALVYLSGLL